MLLSDCLFGLLLFDEVLFYVILDLFLVVELLVRQVGDFLTGKSR